MAKLLLNKNNNVSQCCDDEIFAVKIPFSEDIHIDEDIDDSRNFYVDTLKHVEICWFKSNFAQDFLCKLKINTSK